MKNYKKILVIQTSGIGNVVMLTPFLRNLRENNLTSDITLITSSSSTSDLISETELLNKIIISNFKPVSIKDTSLIFIKSFINFIKLIKRVRYEIVFIVYPSPGFYYPLATFLSKIPIRVGHTYKIGNKSSTLFLTHFVKLHDKHEININIDLLKRMNIPTKYLYPFLPNNQNSNLNDPYLRIGIHAGSGKKMYLKRWGNQNFLDLSERILKRFSNIIIYFLGTHEDDFIVNEKIKLRYPSRIKDFVGYLSLIDTKNRIGECNLFISNDSGLMHIANALDINLVTIMGPTDERIIGPLSAVKDKNIIIKKNLECQPCYIRGTGVLNISCNFLIPCLNEITVDQVFSSVSIMIEKIMDNEFEKS